MAIVKEIDDIINVTLEKRVINVEVSKGIKGDKGDKGDTGSVVPHNELTDIQGGSLTERFHITSDEWSTLGNTSGVNTGDETTNTIKTKLGDADGSNDGYLKKEDWNIFNNKQNYIDYVPEDTTNKIYSFQVTPDNTHYPTEKLVKDSLDSKVDKIAGKGLSTNDLTDTLKSNYDNSVSHISVIGNPHLTNITDLSDVSVTSLTSDQILKWNGSKFINVDIINSVAGSGIQLYFTSNASDIENYDNMSRYPEETYLQTLSVISYDSNKTLFKSYVSNIINKISIDPGMYAFNIYCKTSTPHPVENCTIVIDAYLRDSLGNESYISSVETENISDYISLREIRYFSSSISCNLTDRLVFKIYAKCYSSTPTTVYFYFGDGSYYSYINTPFVIPHNSMPGLQGGSSLEYYHLSSSEHTIATQSASSTVNGYLTSSDWNIFNSKEASGTASGLIANHNSTYVHSDIALNTSARHSHSNKSSLDLVSGTNTGDETNSTIKNKLGVASTTTSGYLTSSDWNAFNGKQAALGFTPENSSNKGSNNGYCGLDSGGKVPLSNLPATLLKYIGTWNATTNSPTLTNPDITKVGYVYNVDTAGTQFGISFKVGDWLIYNSSGVPEKSDNSDDVTSVNGQTGTVVLTTDNVSDFINKRYVTDSYLTVLSNTSGTNSGDETTNSIKTKLGYVNSISDGYLKASDWNTFNGKQNSNANLNSIVGLEYSSSSFVKMTGANTFSLDTNIYEQSLTKGNLTESTSSVLTITGGTGAVIGSGLTIQVKQASSTVNGYLSSTNWSTFNNKQAALVSGTNIKTINSTTVLGSGNFTLQPTHSNLTSLSGLTYVSSSFVKMTGANTFTLDTTTYEPTLTKGNLTEATSSVLTISNGTNSVIGTSTSIQVKQASTSQAGYLSSTDWNTFNNKQDALGFTPENVANKVTSLSSASTDIQYPSAKAVYDCSELKAAQNVGVCAKTPIGANDISINYTTRVLTITPPLGYFHYYTDGNGVVTKHIVTGSVSFPAFTDTSGIWYFYFDNNGTAVVTQTPWDNFDLICSIYRILWNATLTGSEKAVVENIETHPNTISGIDHAWKHKYGAIWYSGFDIIDNRLSSGTPNTDGRNTCISITTGSNIDDNLFYTITNSTGGLKFQQDMGNTSAAALTSSNSGLFKVKIQDAGGLVSYVPVTRFPFPYNTSTNVPQYVTQTGTRVEVSNLYYFVCFVYSMQNPVYGEALKITTSTTDFNTLVNAQAYNWSSIQSAYLNMNDGEVRPLYKLIFEHRTTYNAACKYTVLRQVDDIRKTQITSLATLAGSLPASSVTVVPTGNIASTNVQSALEELDAEKQPLLVSATNIKTINSNSLLGSGDLVVTAAMPTGLVLPFAGSSAPTGALICDGSAISRTTYSVLFALIGTTYGVGDNSTTFNIPDLRAATPRGVGTSTKFTTNKTITLAQVINDQDITHNHPASSSDSGHLHTYYKPNTASAASLGGGSQIYSINQGEINTSTGYASITTSISNQTTRNGDEATGKAIGLNYIIFY